MAANMPAAPKLADATPTSHSRVLALPRCSPTSSLACSLVERTTRSLPQRRPPCRTFWPRGEVAPHRRAVRLGAYYPGMALDVDTLIGLPVTEAKQRAEDEGLRVMVGIEGEVVSADHVINRVVLIVRDDRVVQAYRG